MPTPKDEDAERQVLGSVLVRPDILITIAETLTRDDFLAEPHQIIYDTLLELYSKADSTIDPLVVVNFLKDKAILQKVGGAAYILDLAKDVIAPGNAAIHARRLKGLSIRRELARTAQQISDEATGPVEDENFFLRQVEEQILRITNRSVTPGIVNVNNLKEEFTQYIKHLMEAQGGLTGHATGFQEFDNVTAGIRGGELIVLAARPGMGKTTLALNIASNMSMNNNKHVLIYSLEMSRLELLSRFLCAKTQINHDDLKRGKIQSTKVSAVVEGIQKIIASPMAIDDSGALTVWDCITRTRKHAVDLKNKGESLALIIVDYLQLMTDPLARASGRQNEVASISRTLKQLAKSVNVPILALSQMNRSVEQRKGEHAKPQLSDLRESGAIEQDADMVMFIHREFYADPESPEAQENMGKAEIIIAKHRQGPLHNFKLSYRPSIYRFDNLQ